LNLENADATPVFDWVDVVDGKIDSTRKLVTTTRAAVDRQKERRAMSTRRLS